MIRIKNLTVSFHKKIIIDSIDFDVNRGSTVVLLGKNGSGKSVVLKAIAGLIDNYSGSIEIDKVDTKKNFQDEKKIKEKENVFKIAYVFQKGGLFDSMNVFDNVAFGLRRKKVDEISIFEIVTGSLERVGLKGSENKLPSELSGGMQKRVGLARAICLEPEVILYDDPTAGLDPILSDSIADLMIEVRDAMKTTSIVVTHDLKIAEKIADSILLLYKREIVFSGSSSEFFLKKNSYSNQFIEGEIEGPIDIF